MTVLAIDTSETRCSAALVRAGEVLAERSDDIGRGHAEHLLPMIETLFEAAGTGYADIARVAVTTGPGTFTGLRIGLSVARGLALGLGVPCVGLSGLSILAAGVADEGPVHAVMNGRGDQAYHQAFEGRDAAGMPVPVTDAGSFELGYILAEVAARPGRVVGSGSGFLADASGVVSLDAAVIRPAVLGRLAETLAPDLHAPDPLYLRAADAAKAKPLLPVAP